MECTRCKGLMVADDLIDLQESYVPMWMRGWRCIACGNIVDLLINRHRMVQRSGALGLLKHQIHMPSLVRSVKVA